MEMEYMLLLMSQLRTMGLTADQIDKVLPGLVQALEVDKVSLKEFREIEERIKGGEHSLISKNELFTSRR